MAVSGNLWQILATIVVLLKLENARGLCPHLEEGLMRWSNADTWGGTKPQEGNQVTLTSGMHVLLDESPPPLDSITVQSGATLVWDDIDGITLTLSYLMINGDFHMGSDDCRFEKKANIILTGLSNSTQTVPGFGRKFIGVGSNGTLELHGREKLSWTKLTASIPAAADTCGIVYDHKKTAYDSEWGTGVHVIVWNTDGSMYDFGVFFTGESWDTGSEIKLVQFLTDIPKDKIVALGVHRNLGPELKPERDWESLYVAMENLGGIPPNTSEIRNVKDKEAYALITMTGSPELTMEQHVPRGPDDEYTITDDVHLVLWDEKLKFLVESAVLTTNNWRLPHDLNFRVVSTDVAFPKIEVTDDVSSWMPGDRLVFTSTDIDWRQAEEFEVFPCDDCAANQFRVKGEFRYPHYGKIYDGVDERGEVALLSRDIVIEGQMESECYVTDTHKEKEGWLCSLYDFDHFGGHLKVTKGFASVHIQGIELYHMGQQAFSGSYPIHFHMCDDVSGSWARNNSIHHSLARCVTIHGTDGLEVSDNVCYDHLGHGYFLEDSVEQYNILDGNIGIGTKHGTHILTDMQNKWCNKTIAWNCNSLSTFWITHYNNYIRNNVAAGSDNSGFWFNYAAKPLGPSAARQAEKAANGEAAVTEFSTRHTPILEFDNNVAHSNKERGLMFDSKISNGHWERNKFIPENARFGHNDYDPREPNTPEGKQVTTYIKRLTVYKNGVENIWLRAGNVVLTNCSIADSQKGLTMARSKHDTFTEVRNSVFIGMSDNKGVGGRRHTLTKFAGAEKPTHLFDRTTMSWNPNDPQQGFIFYDGPNYINNCYFNDFYHWHWNQTWDEVFGVPGYRTGGAISWRRGSMLVFNPQSSLSGLKFGFCDSGTLEPCSTNVSTAGNWAYDGNTTVPGFGRDNDGKLQAMAHDVDGSLTGVPNSQIVKNIPFFTSPRCTFRENWGMSACPHSYAKIGIHSDVWQGDRNHKPVYFIRDDAHEAPFAMKFGQGRSYHFMLNKTYTVHFNTTVPRYFKMQADNMQLGDFIRVGVCMPKDMTAFELSSWYPSYNKWRPPVEVGTIEELDADTSGKAYFWDKQVGMIFVKLMSNETRTDRKSCPNGKCPNFMIRRTDGSNTADCRTSVYGPYIKQPEAATTELSRPACTKTTYEGFGAGDTRPATVQTPATLDEPVCPAPAVPAPEPTADQSRGCMVDTWRRDFQGKWLQLHNSMTRGFCIQRCAQQGYRYAGLQNSNECYCDNSFGAFGSGEGCTKLCTGNRVDGNTCGGAWRNEVFSTGLVGVTTQSRCGPGSRGIVIDGVCYYVGEAKKTFMDAQRACVMMGGDLATIPSEEVNSAIKNYLGQGKSHVWIGLTDVANEGEFIFMDGTIPSFIDGNFGINDPEDFVAMDMNWRYTWDDRRWHDQYRYICQLPMDPASTAVESCGLNSEGRRFGPNGQCYMVVSRLTTHSEAEYECFQHMGVLASVDSDATQREMRNHLIMSGVRMDYWTGEEGEKADSYIELKPDTLFSKNEAAGTDKNGYICRLGSSTTLSPCPEPWQHHDGACYLYTGRLEDNYESISALCNSGSSSMLTVHSKQENDFVYNMVRTFHDGEVKDVLLGYRYRSVFDTFEWIDGSSASYQNWAEGHGMSGLSGGQCSKISYPGNNIVWENTPCAGQEYAAVCKLKL